MFRKEIVIILTFIFLNTAFSANDFDSPCTLNSSGASGTCKLLSECQQIRDEILTTHRLPQTCGFQDTQPIVCCPREPGELSKQKCKLYSSYANADNAECGHKIVKRIVGGVMAGRREFPHMASLGFENNGTILWQCGGIIISEKYILTTAHCVHSKYAGTPKYVQVGVSNINDPNHKQTLNVETVLPYPEYKPSQHYHDIGLIKLEKPIVMNSYARPACLYYDLQRSFEKVIATGWGVTAFGEARSDDLLKVTIKVVEYDECKTVYENSRNLPDGIRNDIHICAGVREDGKDTCQGDTGGPIQIYHTGDDINCMYDIVGITSFGIGCSQGSSVYTRVSFYLKWIEDTVWP